jgi:hypothetical protein
MLPNPHLLQRNPLLRRTPLIVPVFGLFTLMNTPCGPPKLTKPKFLLTRLALFISDQKPTVVPRKMRSKPKKPKKPRLLSPVTCVWTEPGKFSLMKSNWVLYGRTTV